MPINRICPLPYKFQYIFSLYHQSVSLPISLIHHRLVFYPQICCNISSWYELKEGRHMLIHEDLYSRSRVRIPDQFIESELVKILYKIRSAMKLLGTVVCPQYQTFLNCSFHLISCTGYMPCLRHISACVTLSVKDSMTIWNFSSAEYLDFMKRPP